MKLRLVTLAARHMQHNNLIWRPAYHSNPFLSKISTLFEELKVIEESWFPFCDFLSSNIRCLNVYLRVQQQVDQAISEQKRRDTFEREQSRRIAELYPILWPAERSTSSALLDSINSVSFPNADDGEHYQTLVCTRTPSPPSCDHQKHTDCSIEKYYFDPRSVTSSPVKTRSSIRKTPKRAYVKSDMPFKAGSAERSKSLKVLAAENPSSSPSHN